MLKKISLIIFLIIISSAGIFLYFFFRAGGEGTVRESFAPGGGALESAQNIPDSNVFNATEINPFEGGYKNPFE